MLSPKKELQINWTVKGNIIKQLTCHSNSDIIFVFAKKFVQTLRKANNCKEGKLNCQCKMLIFVFKKRLLKPVPSVKRKLMKTNEKKGNQINKDEDRQFVDNYDFFLCFYI